MSTASREHVATVATGAADWDIWRCPECRGALRVRLVGAGDGRASAAARGYRIEDDILIVKDRTSRQQPGRPGVLRQPALAQVPVLGEVHLVLQRRRAPRAERSAQAPARAAGLDLLDVAIGDGVYLDWLPADWRIVGRRHLAIPARRLPPPRRRGRDVRLAQGEAEDLPLADRQFDAVLSIGAFNYFNDPEGSLREMVRVARPGAPIVISDEMPNLTDRMLGHKLGIPALDRWIVSRLMHLGDSFTDMVERLSRPRRPGDRRARAARMPSIIPVWRGVGYVLVGHAPS